MLRQPAKITLFRAADRLPFEGERLGRITTYVASTKQWLLSQGREEDYEVVRPASHDERSEPRPHGDPHAHEFNRVRCVTHPETFIATLHHPYVLTKTGVVLSRERALLVDSVTTHAVLTKSSLLEKSIWPKVERLGGGYTIPHHQQANNYGLWLVEMLPRLKPFIEPPLDDVKVLLPPRSSPWLVESVKKIGIAEERIHIAEAGHVQVEKLFFSSKPGAPQSTPRWVAQWLQKQLSPEPISDGAGQKKRLYISRENASERAVGNEGAVLDMLRQHGFEKVLPETMNFQEQVDLFSKASFLVAPHGAGNANILFAHDLKFIELFGPTYVRPRYYSVAESLGHTYRYLVSTEVENLRKEEIIVDVPRLERLVEILLQESPE